MPKRQITVKERFESHVGEKDSKGCRIWNAYIHFSGYGRFGFRGKIWFAHRVRWVLKKGEIPEGMQVHHTCDNRACVEIEHLYLGDYVDNMKDMVERGRSSKGKSYNVGEKHPKAKLTWEIVKELRSLHKKGKLNVRARAEELGIGINTIYDVLTERTWKE